MNTITYKGWTIHETLLAGWQRPGSVSNGFRVVSPGGNRYTVRSMHAAKCLISRKSAQR